MTTILNLAGRLKSNLNNLSQEITDASKSVGAAAEQYKQLTTSSSSAEIGERVGGIDVVAKAKDGSVSVGVFSDKLDNVSTLAPSGSNLQRTVSAITAEATSESIKNVVGQMNILTTEQLNGAALLASEALGGENSLPTGASSAPLITKAAEDVRAIQEKFLDRMGFENSILEDITGESDLSDALQLLPLVEQSGEPSISVNAMENIASSTYLQTFEEIEAYLRSSRREFTEVVVHSTDTTRDMMVNYQVLHKWDLDRGASDVGYHFIIQPDGSLEVCRPIFIEGAHCLKGHNKNSIGIAFVGGILGSRENTNIVRSHKSYTNAQWKTFEAFMKAFYTVVPGGQAWGHNSIDPTRRSDPHFNVPKFVEKRFGKTNTQTAEETRVRGPLTIDELIEAQY